MDAHQRDVKERLGDEVAVAHRVHRIGEGSLETQ